MSERAGVPIAGTIDLRTRSISRLLDVSGSFPFDESGLSGEAERYIVEHAGDLPKDRPIAIVAHVDDGEDVRRDEAALSRAVADCFSARVTDETREMAALFRDGRWALLIGLTILGICLFMAWQLSVHFEGPLSRILGESFVIVGWVVIWRPAEMFLYDWVPIVRRRKLFRRLATASVSVRTDALHSRIDRTDLEAK